MISFSKQERLVVLSLIFVVAFGSVLSYAFKEYPFLKNIVNVMDTDRLYLKIDVNTASQEELVSIPFIGEYTAGQIIRHRQRRGFIKSLDEIKSLPGIHAENYKKFSRYLTLEKKGGG